MHKLTKCSAQGGQLLSPLETDRLMLFFKIPKHRIKLDIHLKIKKEGMNLPRVGEASRNLLTPSGYSRDSGDSTGERPPVSSINDNS